MSHTQSRQLSLSLFERALRSAALQMRESALQPVWHVCTIWLTLGKLNPGLMWYENPDEDVMCKCVNERVFECVEVCSEPSCFANVRAVKRKRLRIRCGLSNYDFISACIKLLFVCELNWSLAADSALPTIPEGGQSDLEPDCRHTWAASVRRAR